MMIGRHIVIEQYANNERAHVELKCSESSTSRANSGEETNAREFKQRRWIDIEKLPDFIQRFMQADSVQEVMEL